MSAEKKITKTNFNIYLKELAKAYRKINKNKVLIELIIVGGGSILVNYGFRETTVISKRKRE